jgi:hypothetical protein
MIREIDLLELRNARLQAELSLEELDHQIMLLRELYEKPYLRRSICSSRTKGYSLLKIREKWSEYEKANRSPARAGLFG